MKRSNSSEVTFTSYGKGSLTVFDSSFLPGIFTGKANFLILAATCDNDTLDSFGADHMMDWKNIRWEHQKQRKITLTSHHIMEIIQFHDQQMWKEKILSFDSHTPHSTFSFSFFHVSLKKIRLENWNGSVMMTIIMCFLFIPTHHHTHHAKMTWEEERISIVFTWGSYLAPWVATNDACSIRLLLQEGKNRRRWMEESSNVQLSVPPRRVDLNNWTLCRNCDYYIP